MRTEILRDVDALARLAPEWTGLWRQSAARPLTLHPAWVEAWWRALGGDGELVVVACFDGGLRGVAPFWKKPPQGGTLRVRELRLAGDGIVAATAALLSARDDAPAAADAVAAALAGEGGWDLIDFTLLSGEAVEAIASGFDRYGLRVERAEVEGPAGIPLVGDGGGGGGAGRDRGGGGGGGGGRGGGGGGGGARAGGGSGAPGPDGTSAVTGAAPHTVRVSAAEELEDSLATLAELASRAAGSQRLGERGFVEFLERAVPALLADDAAALWRCDDERHRLLAAELVLVDGDRRIELLRGAVAGEAAAAAALTAAAVLRASGEGAVRFVPFEPDTLPPSPHGAVASRAPGTRLRVYSATAAGMLQAGYDTLGRHASTVADAAREELNERATRARRAATELAEAASGSIDRFRDATGRLVERAVARVATFSKLHLYRGELFVRGAAPAPVSLRLFPYAEYRALLAPELFLRRLDLVDAYCRQKWERGDEVVLAELDGEPAGVVWCARQPVYVPDIGREVRPQAGECYIHDVYVHPSARGRAVAPAMLEFLAGELRRRDVYRAWALIESSNTSSTRAFEKAAYASVADVIYARMGMASKLLVRPPVPEARAFLGLGAGGGGGGGGAKKP